jgi:hypothetical protein
MACSDEDHGRSRRPGAENRGWSHRSGTRWLGDREVGWHRVRSALCTWRRGARVSWLSLKTKVDGLSVVWTQNHTDGFSSVWASKLMAMVCEWFGLKTTRTVFVSLASKPVVTVSGGLASKPAPTVSDGLASKPAGTVSGGLASKPAATVSGGLASKPTMTVFRFGLKTDGYGLVIWASKSPQRFLCLGLKTKWVTVCRLRLKTDGSTTVWDTRLDLATCFTWKQVGLGFSSLASGLTVRGATTGGAHGTIAEVASEAS